MTHRKLAYFIGVLALAVLYLLPGLIFSYKSVQEPWTLFRLARSSLSLPAEHIVQFAGEAAAYRGEHIGGELLLVSLLRLTGLPLESLALLPLGALLLPALTFVVIRVISRSTWLAFWLSLFTAWYYPRLYSHYAVQTYVWTDALFLCFVLFFWLWLQRPSARLSILLVVIFAAAFLHYQTTPLWMMAAVFSGVLLVRWRRNLYPPDLQPPSWALPLVFLVIYLQFDTVFYGNFLSRLRQEPVEHLLAANFTSKILAPLLGGKPAALGQFAAAALSPRLATWTTLLVILGLSLPVLAWCLWKILRSLRSRQLSRLVERVDDIFTWSLLLVFAAHALAYSVYGAVSLRLVDLVFPLLLPVVLVELPHGLRIANRLAPALAGCALVGCLSYLPALRPDILARETGRVDDLLADESRLLADANTFGGLLLNASQDGKLFDLVWLDGELYAASAGHPRVPQAGFDYLVADSLGKPVTSRGWVFYQPWERHLQEIEANPRLDKIYTSSILSVFQPAGRQLPATQAELGSSSPPDWPVWLEAGRTALAVLWLVFIPGALLALFLLPEINLPLGEGRSWPVFLVLSVGLSLAVHTLAGYLANFTNLGLGWQQPLVLILTIIGLFSLHTSRLMKPPPASWLVVLLGLALLGCWSLGAALVDHYRSEIRGPGLEFFLTGGSLSDRQITAHIAIHAGQPQSCSLRVSMPDRPVQEYGPFRLLSGDTRMVEFMRPEESSGERILFILDCERKPPYTLHLNSVSLARTGANLAIKGPDDPP